MYGDQTPIDIYCSNLVDWLVQRRHCRKDWGENLALIRRKIRAALGDMPENEEIKQLLIGSKLDYFKSRRIVDILKTTEASSKNIFGYYSSQRMKDWQDIVYSYEKDHIYLAEDATDLIRETNYEVPGFKKVITRLNKEKDELEGQRKNMLRRAQQFTSEYQKMAQSYDINGEDVVAELSHKSNSLSAVMNDIVNLCKNLEPSLKHYRKYASATTKQDPEKLLPMLSYIMDKGNTTVYEWTRGVPPEKIEVLEKTSSISCATDIDNVDDEIDFGEEIDFTSSESSSGFVHVDKQSDEGNTEDSFINVEDPTSKENGNVARGDNAKLVLEFRKSRNQFLNNLHELEAFYQQLSSESANNMDKNTSFSIDNNPKTNLNKSEIEKISSDIRQIIGIMNQEKNKILFQMHDSANFINMVKEKFANKRKQISDCNLKTNMIADQIKKIERDVKETEVHLKRSLVYANELQGKVESSLSELYKGRPINIMGCYVIK